MALALVVVTGCGNGSPSRSASRTTPPPDITRTAAARLVAAGTLRAGDLPGYRFARAKADADSARTQRELDLCVGGPAIRTVLDDPGVEFTKGPLEIDSSVSVVATAAEGRADLATTTGPDTKACVEKVFTGLLAQQGVTVTNFTMTRVPMTVPGADGAFCYLARIDGRKDVPATFRVVEGGALVGHAELEITAITFDGPLPPVASIRALLVRSVKRVKAAA
jgi:hypothetical protein